VPPDDGRTPASDRPNLVVVVLDCVRASSFPGTGGPVGRLPSLEALREECTVFTRASTVAPWTLPSHATLFTGRYPWEHGVLGEGRMQFENSMPTTARALRDVGYSTLALSANGLLQPLLAAPGSFEEYRCAEWWEKSFRWIRPESLDASTATAPRNGRNALAILAGAARSRAPPRTSTSLLHRESPTQSLPDAVHAARPEQGQSGRRTEALAFATLDASNRVARALRVPRDPHPLPVSPWIEPTFDAWLKDQPSERPIHLFVNFLDAHEKYLSDAHLDPGLVAWWRFVRIPQNARRWLEGEWTPSSEELSRLRGHYEATLEVLDRRIARLVASLREAGRWENTLLMVTSDHGQAFGEHGDLFHERSPAEALLHVPLWVRWPHGRRDRALALEPVGLVDIAPTLLEAAGCPEAFQTSGRPLQRSERDGRAVPLLAMADGFPTIENYRGHLDATLAERLRRSFAVAYEGDVKTIVSVRDGSVRSFRLGVGPDLDGDEIAETSDVGRTVEFARGVAAELARSGDGDVDASVEDRLRSWGYL
jgi:arylsulfatase A-like enzyme